MPEPSDDDAERPDPPADPFVTVQMSARMADGGPRYQETPPDPRSADAPTVAEPWNTATAGLFVLIVAVWAWRLRGRYSQFPFVVGGLVVLFVGGVGGMLYHATRAHWLFLAMDVLPIQLLGGAGAIYLLVRIGRRAGRRRLYLAGLGAVAACVLVNVVVYAALPAEVVARFPALQINVSYASLAALLLVPLAAVLMRTRFRHGRLVLAALLSFAVAWFCRLVDRPRMGVPPMGTHWLWHTFGAVTTALLIEYFHRLEREDV